MVYRISNSAKIGNDTLFKNQIRCAAFDIAHSIAHGCEHGDISEYIRHLQSAKGSSAQVRSMIQTAFTLHYVNSKDMMQLKNMLIDQSVSIGRLIKTIDKSRKGK